jgi:hypothetical protein
MYNRLIPATNDPTYTPHPNPYQKQHWEERGRRAPSPTRTYRILHFTVPPKTCNDSKVLCTRGVLLYFVLSWFYSISEKLSTAKRLQMQRNCRKQKNHEQQGHRCRVTVVFMHSYALTIFLCSRIRCIIYYSSS